MQTSFLRSQSRGFERPLSTFVTIIELQYIFLIWIKNREQFDKPRIYHIPGICISYVAVLIHHPLFGIPPQGQRRQSYIKRPKQKSATLLYRTLPHSINNTVAHPEILQNLILELNIAVSRSCCLGRCPAHHRHDKPYTALLYAAAEHHNNMRTPVAPRGGDLPAGSLPRLTITGCYRTENAIPTSSRRL